VVVDGEVLEADPPHKLVQTWRLLMDPAIAAEGFTRLTYEIEPQEGGFTRLTVSHDLTGAPKLALLTGGLAEGDGGGGGWPWILSALKSLLETARPWSSGTPDPLASPARGAGGRGLHPTGLRRQPHACPFPTRPNRALRLLTGRV
jgi:hypothetical protein